MKYILFEASVIANTVKCDNFKVNQTLYSKDDIWVDLEFIHTDFTESYSIANNGYVYYSVRMKKNRFLIVDNELVSRDYREWIKNFDKKTSCIQNYCIICINSSKFVLKLQ